MRLLNNKGPAARGQRPVTPVLERSFASRWLRPFRTGPWPLAPFLLVLALALAAQTPSRPPAPAHSAGEDEDVPLFRADTRLVDLHVSVLDKNGRMITDVPESAFKVYENNVEQKIKKFLREDVPVSMGLIIDNSGSMKEKRARVDAASLALVKASNPQDEVFIVSFSDDAWIEADFTNDIKKLESALDNLNPKGGTAMRDAISLSIDKVKEGKREKKVLLVVTDGNDNTSDITLEQLVRKAQQSEVLIYCIGLLSEEEPHDARSAKRALKELAEASGGQDYYPKDLAEVARITPQIANEIRSQYYLGYSPSNANLDGSFRQIRVQVNGFGKPTVRAKNGYYATPVAPAKDDPALYRSNSK
jgi:VWFA-related protein